MGQVIPIEQLAELATRLRRDGKRIVFTNGHFDLLHVGHLRYLRAARQLGDVLIVGVNDDANTTARKGLRRPIIPEGERAELVAGLECVDFASIFHEPTAHAVLERLEPEIYVKGGDYSLDPQEGATPLPEAEAVRRYGGDVRILPLAPGNSTSDIEQRIIERWRQHGHDTP